MCTVAHSREGILAVEQGGELIPAGKQHTRVPHGQELQRGRAVLADRLRDAVGPDGDKKPAKGRWIGSGVRRQLLYLGCRMLHLVHGRGASARLRVI